MKTNIILIITIIQVGIFSLQAQVGVNTNSPKGVFHIDSKKNTPVSAGGIIVQALDDIVIDNKGNLGVGTLDPQAKLHIVTGGTALVPKVGVKIVDGLEADTKVLTSDAVGSVSWQDAPPMPTAIATKIGVNIPSNASSFYNTNSYIVLPPGRWKVTATMLVGSVASTTIHDKIWVKSLFTESSAATVSATDISADVESGKAMAALMTKFSYNIMIGNTIINNMTDAPKTYYYCVGSMQQVGTSAGNRTFNLVGGMLNEENSIVAVLIQD
ncbi:hypothetical protein LJC00_03680 [Dysgonomonas sp. OttesenSCG-928-M03]|nr:hypothetical protein [Dysgonomonas sp. OttesenSCG-928-M03]